MAKIGIGDKLRYRFDNLMSKGPIALIGALAVISILIIASISWIVWFFNFYPEEDQLINIMWMSLMRTLDAGTMGGDEGSWGYLLAMFAVTIGGIFVISTLIGILTTGIESKLEELQKGRSRVIEKNHTVVLGWSEQVITIISEISLANANQRKGCIVVLGEADKTEMEENIRNKVGPTGRTKVVCRQGSPIDLNDLALVNLNDSRAIIIISPENENEADSSVIKTLVAIINNPERRKSPYNIVAEIRDPNNLEVAKIVGKDEVEIVLVGDLISRIVAQTCRQPGLSAVYMELLDFGGSEIYFKEEPALTGKSFRDVLPQYEESTVIGIFTKDKAAKLNPPMDSVLGACDRLIVIAEDDDTIKLKPGDKTNLDKSLIVTPKDHTLKTEKVLMLGWNWRLPAVIRELDNYVPKGSAITIVAHHDGGEEHIKKECSGLIKNLSVRYLNEDPTNRRVLDRLTAENFQHIIVVCYDHMEIQQADAITLIILLHLRDIAQKTGKDFNIVSEMLDIRNRNLAEVAKVNDFIISDKLISLMLSQISENKYLNPVFQDLFDPDGSEVYLKPAADYVKLNVPVSMHTITEAAAQRQEIPLGYKLEALISDPKKGYGIIINPRKSELVTFTETDKIIVLSET